MPAVRCQMPPTLRLTWLLVVCLFCCCMTPAGFATEPSSPQDIGHRTADSGLKKDLGNFAVEVSASANAINVGGSLTVTVTYRWPAGWAVVAPLGEPDPAKDFADCFVTNLPPPQKQSSGQEERRVYTITMAAVRDGVWELPRPTLTVQTPEGSRSTVAAAVLVHVGAEDQPAQLPPPRKAWTRTISPLDDQRAWWALAVVAVALAGLVAMVMLRRRQHQVIRTPWEQFYDDWQIAASAADGKEAGARLSIALRRCLGTVFRFDGPASTTRETALHLRGQLRDDEHRDLVRLLESLDALRWAADDLPPSAVRPLVELGRGWSTALKHRLAAEEEAARLANPQSAKTAAKTAAKTSAKTTAATNGERP